MRKAPIGLQDLRRKLYHKAKAEPSWRFWGLYVHICKLETLREAYRLAKANDGAPGSDGVTFEAIDAEGVEAFLVQLREELVQRTYRPMRLRKVGIPKEGGTRSLAIPAIRDRVVQGALKLILEPIFEADFQPGSYGYRPKKSAHEAVQRVAEAILEGKTYVIDLDLTAYFETIQHYQVLAKVARRVNDAEVMHVLKLLLTSAGKQGVPQGAVPSPLISNLYGRLFGRTGTVASMLPWMDGNPRPHSGMRSSQADCGWSASRRQRDLCAGRRPARGRRVGKDQKGKPVIGEDET